MKSTKKKLIKNIISKILKVDQKIIKDNHKMGDLREWDSLAQINIYLELNKKFNKKIPIEKLSKTKSIKNWIDLFI